jgi:hypothetical protein
MHHTKQMELSVIIPRVVKDCRIFFGGITNGHSLYEHHERVARMVFKSVMTISDTIGKIFYYL